MCLSTVYMNSGNEPKEVIIVSPDKKTCERLRVLINMLFPEADVLWRIQGFGEVSEMPWGSASEPVCCLKRKRST